jgi:hypothetical protein
VFLAQEFDAVADGVPYLSSRRIRLISPDLRSRIVGYLATAPEAAPGFRTDGAWVWPEALADHVREQGARPQAQLFEHMQDQWFLLPDSVSEQDLAEAARVAAGPPTPDPPSHPGDEYFRGERPGASPHTLLLWQFHDERANSYERLYTVDGWTQSSRLTSKRIRPELDPWEYEEIAERDAADLNTEQAARFARAALRAATETDPDEHGLRLARVFDGESPTGTPMFSPARLRIPELTRRQRLATYLAQGRLVVRATGHVADPLDPSRGPVVPLSYRTDGTWIWQEALAYYVLNRGAAPELELLCHIEERGYRLPDLVPTDIVRLAAGAVPAGPHVTSTPEPAPEPMAYLRSDSGALFRARGGSPFETDLFDRDLRWGGSDRLWRSRYSDSEEVFTTISEQEAIDVIERCWRSGTALPPYR